MEVSPNPFDDPELAARYEDWYRGPGAEADHMEKLLLGELLTSFAECRTLLEVGCGTGHFTRWLERQGLSAAGVDLSTSMLDEARRLGSRGLTRADAVALPFADRSFDLVAMITLLEFLDEPERALRESVRVARRGLVLGALNRWSVYGLRRRLGAKGPWGRARFLGPARIRRLLERAAGERALGLRWRAVSWSLPPRGTPLRLPCGDFLGFALQLGPSS